MDPYLKEMAPLLILSKFAARGPFRINENGKFVVELLSLHGIYFVLSFGLITYSLIDAHQRNNVFDYFIRGDFMSLYTAVMNVLVVLLHFSIFYSIFTKWEPTVKYIEEWAELNVEYEEVMGAKHEYKCGRIVFITALSIPLISVMTTTATIELVLGSEWYHLAIPAFTLTSVTSDLAGVIFSYVELKFMASSINTKLESLIRNNCMSAEELFALRRLWLKCSRVARLTGTSCTIQLLVDVTASATVYAVGVFVFVSSLTTDDSGVVKYIPFIVITCWFRLFCLFQTGELTAHHIWTNTEFTISTARIEPLDIGTANEVELFIQCVSLNYSNLSINGFMSISRRSVTLLMEKANLYVIVLMQIQLSKKLELNL